MTASPGREVDANLLRGAALESAQTRAHPQDAGRQDLSDLVQALGRGQEFGVESVAGRTVALSQLTVPGCGRLYPFYSRALMLLPPGADRPFALDSMVWSR
jgi:hypothetical protein